MVDRVGGDGRGALEENELADRRKEDVLCEAGWPHIVESDLDVVEDELNLEDFDLTGRGDVESVLVGEEDRGNWFITDPLCIPVFQERAARVDGDEVESESVVISQTKDSNLEPPTYLQEIPGS